MKTKVLPSCLVFIVFCMILFPHTAAEKSESGSVFVLKSESGLIAVNIPDAGEPLIQSLGLDCDLGEVGKDGQFYSVKIGQEKTRVGFHNLFPEFNTISEAELPSPHIRSVLAVDSDLYLGGKNLWRVNFHPARIQVEEYEKVPPEGEDEGSELFKNKTIDALARTGPSLYAVDNIWAPKFLLIYDVSQSFNPRHLLTRDFGGGVNQRVYGADADKNHLMVFEKYSRMDGWGTLISVYLRDPLKKIRQSETHFSIMEAKWEERDRDDWSNALLLDGKIVISGGKAGLLVSDISREEAPLQLHSSPCRWVLKRGNRLMALHGSKATVYTLSGSTPGNPVEIELPAECRRIF
jgi:hypothetical protein